MVFVAVMTEKARIVFLTSKALKSYDISLAVIMLAASLLIKNISVNLNHAISSLKISIHKDGF
jgi:hypothetical protein